jgi:hypothetical protein
VVTDAIRRAERCIPSAPGPLLLSWCKLHALHLVALSLIDELDDIEEAADVAVIAHSLHQRKARIYRASEGGGR